jgi:hypothetical protein
MPVEQRHRGPNSKHLIDGQATTAALWFSDDASGARTFFKSLPNGFLDRKASCGGQAFGERLGFPRVADYRYKSSTTKGKGSEKPSFLPGQNHRLRMRVERPSEASTKSLIVLFLLQSDSTSAHLKSQSTAFQIPWFSLIFIFSEPLMPCPADGSGEDR